MEGLTAWSPAGAPAATHPSLGDSDSPNDSDPTLRPYLETQFRLTKQAQFVCADPGKKPWICKEGDDDVVPVLRGYKVCLEKQNGHKGGEVSVQLSEKRGVDGLEWLGRTVWKWSLSEF